MNASTSDVVATTSIEALAMGKWLVCARHPCNAFAQRFPNTLAYGSRQEFCAHLQHALSHEPQPLDEATLQCAAASLLVAAGGSGMRTCRLLGGCDWHLL